MDLTRPAAAIAERAVAPERFAIGGAVPRQAARPLDRDELCELLRAATRDGLRVVPWGGGTTLPFEAPPGRYDLALDLAGLDRVVEYDPEDLTLTAECGVTLATLCERLGASGQELPLEGGDVARATLGGVLACNASGARRLALGAPRDRILGARFALGDGTLARTGGKVVKNVAGYAIHRLLCGSRGGLAVLVEASLKLLPAPAARRARLYALDLAALADGARWGWLPRAEPAVFTVVDGATASAAALPGARAGAAAWVVVGFEDDPPRLAELDAACDRALGPAHATLAGAEAESLWRQLADLAAAPRVQLGFTSPHRTPVPLAALWPDLARHASGWMHHAAWGALLATPAGDSAAGLVEPLARAGFVLREARGMAAPPAVERALATSELRGRIRAALDPGGRMALGPRWVESLG